MALTPYAETRMSHADIGLIGLAVMGENLALNIENKGYTVAVFNRADRGGLKVEDFLAGRAKGKNVVPCQSLEELCKSLKQPRKILLMVKAGKAIDELSELLMPYLSQGDIIIDGGNSFFPDTARRVAYAESKGFLFVGTGVSGGEEGALKGPSLMPGGSTAAWEHIKPIFQAIAAKVEDGTPCCLWIGEGGAGHFVKMVHNGIEYSDMQLICEAYHILRSAVGMSVDEIQATFASWNQGDLNSYLIGITSEILKRKDPETGQPMVDVILDTAGQKGTGKWTSATALDLGVPTPTIAEAVFTRCMSAIKDERVEASKKLRGPKAKFTGNRAQFVEAVRDALFASKVCSYAQGFALMRQAAEQYGWTLDYGSIALVWRNGCIIRAQFLDRIKDAFDRRKKLANLLLDATFKKIVVKSQRNWRKVVSMASKLGVPIPAFSSALAYFDAYRSERLPANLLQAQRDYFGAHTYERVDKPRGTFFHTDWLA